MKKNKYLLIGIVLCVIIGLVSGCAASTPVATKPASSTPTAVTTAPVTTSAALPKTTVPPTTTAQTTTTAPAVQSAADFYKGKTLTIIVPFAPGANTDLFPRLLSSYITAATGANVIVQNKPEGGGLVALNGFFTDAKADGLTIVCCQACGLPEWLSKNANAKYDPSKWELLGGMPGGTRALCVALNGPATVQDMITASKAGKQYKFAGGAVGTIDFNNMWMICDALSTIGFNGKVIPGYSGFAPQLMALAQGEVDGVNSSTTTASRYATQMKIILGVADKKDATLPNLPILTDYIKPDAAQNSILQVAMEGPNGLGTTLIAPPGTPQDRVKFLADVFVSISNDKGFQTSWAAVDTWLGFTTAEQQIKVRDSLVATRDQYSTAVLDLAAKHK